MSAFLVGNDCINSIVTYMHMYSDCFQWIAEKHQCNIATEEGAGLFAQALFQMNCDAIVQRYGKKALESDLAERGPFRFQIVRRAPVEIFKAIHCLAYQCSEGNVPEQDLFKALGDISVVVGNAIVYRLPDYEKAPWGD